MFDRYMLVEDSLTRGTENGREFIQVGIRYPHHCGIWVSIIEKLELWIDGEPVPGEDMTLVLHGNEYPVTRLGEEEEDRWNFGEIGWLRIWTEKLPEAGAHELTLEIGLRVSFLAWLLTGSDTKQMLLKSQ